MGHTIKGQRPRQYRPSATRRPSGLSPITESSVNARESWNKLRRSRAHIMNSKLVELANHLDETRKKLNARHEKQIARLHNQAAKLGALRDSNYLNAVSKARKLRKNGLVKLHGMRNKLVRELVRNSASTQARRNLYARGIAKGRHGTSQNNWQNWTNKLWHVRGAVN